MPEQGLAPFIVLDDISLRADGKMLFEHTSWTVRTGEHWDIQRHIGWVSPGLQLYYHRDITCHQVVCSGLFDTIGLWTNCRSRLPMC